jgi:hypothetical protein
MTQPSLRPLTMGQAQGGGRPRARSEGTLRGMVRRARDGTGVPGGLSAPQPFSSAEATDSDRYFKAWLAIGMALGTNGARGRPRLADGGAGLPEGPAAPDRRHRLPRGFSK